MVVPTVLLELGFMTHPAELEWSVNPQLAHTLAQGVCGWLEQATPNQSVSSR